jgi:SAM-dependent methyltransferase
MPASLRPARTSPDWDPERYAREARFVADFGQALLPLVAPQPDERILDIGCGDGVLTQELALSGCRVVGVDASPLQVEAARRRGVTALVCDGHSLQFDREFDAAFSNAALHWMRRPDDVLAGIARALKPGGRFVAEFGGHGNVATICGAMRDALQRRGHSYESLNPWYFPSADEYRAKLIRAGFDVPWLNSFARPTPLPGDILGWLETFAQSFTIGWSPEERTNLFSDVRDACRAQLCDADGRWTADYVRLRFVAVKR